MGVDGSSPLEYGKKIYIFKLPAQISFRKHVDPLLLKDFTVAGRAFRNHPFGGEN